MIVIGDSSVFINFALVGEFNCLKYIAPICVPEAVYNEVYSKGSYKPGSQEFYNATKEGWIIVKKCPYNEFYYKLKRLHSGEREVLTLAKELSADLVLLDDDDAISACHVWLKPHNHNIYHLTSFGLCELLRQKGFTKINHIEMCLKINQADTLIKRS